MNGGSHNNGYTALHFAGLSGNAPLCQLLLQKGANSMVKNSVSRTPAQMAAFVGKTNLRHLKNNTQTVPRRTIVTSGNC